MIRLPFPKATVFELHVSNDPAFTRKFGKAVKAVGGDYSACRGYSSRRFVTVPCKAENFELVDRIADTFHAKTIIVRGNYRGDGLPGVYSGSSVNSACVLYERWLKDTEAWYERRSVGHGRTLRLHIRNPSWAPTLKGVAAREFRLTVKLLKKVRQEVDALAIVS
jgi:hypothetical protein